LQKQKYKKEIKTPAGMYSEIFKDLFIFLTNLFSSARRKWSSLRSSSRALPYVSILLSNNSNTPFPCPFLAKPHPYLFILLLFQLGQKLGEK